jgi:hypothetical protein
VEVSVSDEINQITMGRPHVVLLGAGASRASFPVGERSGKLLPLMKDFVDIVPVGDVLREAGCPFEGRNFENIYGEIVRDPAQSEFREQLEMCVYNYFDSLELPEQPTIYDHLLLSLRSKDVIATFNWDPFLIQAAGRNRILRGRLPTIIFLHGNVLAGFCHSDTVHGVKGAVCPRCGRPFAPSKLLYPIGEKDYHRNPMIRDAWRGFQDALENAFMLTIFGYNAPVSDRSAMDLLRGAWGNWQGRDLEQVEIVDIKPEDTLVATWADFIHTHHYEVHADFYDCWIANHPRRTGEAYLNQYIEAKWIEANPLPKAASFPDLWKWFQPLLEVENREQN